ncbi:MAG: pyridoxal 5'-phosphate synthase glutaminase subunit PdxT [Lachnospiraceae bacterium]|nr:pyridoxal 5'-phosphate synthase glutaminase subunit PdxT [Lachnospiraceae bacterium]
MKIAVLAVQGAFLEHEKMLDRLGVDYLELRKKEDLKESYNGIILPGGESTVQGKLIRELGFYDILKEQIHSGMPVLATCAGLILLAEKAENDDRTHFATLPVTVKRNAYGRQLGSFYKEDIFEGIGKVPMTFIRAPYITNVKEDVSILARDKEFITAVSYGNQLAMSFHPELDEDTKIHQKFVKMVEKYITQKAS